VGLLLGVVQFAPTVTGPFGRQIPPAKLVGDDPADGSLTVLQVHLDDSVGNIVFRTKLVTKVPLKQNPMVLPHNQRIAAATGGEKVMLQLGQLLLRVRRDQGGELGSMMIGEASGEEWGSDMIFTPFVEEHSVEPPVCLKLED